MEMRVNSKRHPFEISARSLNIPTGEIARKSENTTANRTIGNSISQRVMNATIVVLLVIFPSP